MRYFTDGDQLAIVKDDFIDLQSSPAVFFPLEGEVARTVLEVGKILALKMDDLFYIRRLPDAAEKGESEWEW